VVIVIPRQSRERSGRRGDLEFWQVKNLRKGLNLQQSPHLGGDCHSPGAESTAPRERVKRRKKLWDKVGGRLQKKEASQLTPSR